MQRIAHIDERDVDLLLLEEMWSSEPFRRWLLEQIGCDSTDHRFVHAERSVAGWNGESDLEMVVDLQAGRVHVLVENKIDAPFQVDQGARYQERAERRVASGACEATRQVLIAPRRYYLGRESTDELRSFDATVAYEDVAAWFEARGDVRASFKARLLQVAVTKQAGGAVSDPQVTYFHQEYWKLQRTVAPSLNMTAPSAKGERSNFVIFRPDALSPYSGRCEFQHKFQQGCIDLELRGRWHQKAAFAARWEGQLPAGVTLARAGQSIALRIPVPRVSAVHDWNGQSQVIAAALANAEHLLEWIQSTGVLEWFVNGAGTTDN